jgi:peptide/nickel transport system substrate-binding protein
MDMNAVKFSVDRVIAAKAPNAPPEIKAITSDEIAGTDKLVLHLKSPVAGALIHTWLKESDGLAIVSPTQVTKLGKAYETQPIGAGPYMYSSFKTDQLLSLRSWPGYWDAAERKLGGIDFIQTARGAPSVTALTSGTIDMVDLSVDDAGSLANRPGFALSRALSDSDLMMPVCQSKPPFDKLAARQALEYALNRADIKKAAFGDSSGAVTDSLLPTTSPLYAKPTPDVDYKFDPAKAKQLLAQAGVAPGTTIEVMIPNTSAGIGPASEVVQSELRDVGLTLKISTGTNFLADLNRIVPNIVLLANKLSAVSFWVTPGGGPNYCKYSNAKLTSAINAAASANDATSKMGWLDQQSIYRSDIPIVFIGIVPVISGHTDKVQGVTIMHSQAAGPLWRTIFIKK